jgi:hypothetical protein
LPKFFAIVLTAILLLGLVFVGGVDLITGQSGSAVEGIINKDTTWTKESSPCNLTGNVLINNEVTLTVEAGVTVNLNGYYIEVNGSFIAKGTDIDPIFFKNGYESNQGIIFDPASISWNQSTGIGSIIENAALDSVGIFCYGATPRINHNLFYNSGNYIQAQYAILFIGPCSKPSMVISNNTFVSNYAQAAIEINSAGVSPPIIINNNFVGTNRYNVQSGFDTPLINATYNWWGTTDSQAINQTIFDYKNNFQIGTVNFVPFLTAPNSQAPTYIISSAGYGGSINPFGYVPVSFGSNKTFNITANNGYHILDVKINGTSIGIVSSYTLQNIQGATTISATFTLNPTVTPIPSPTPTVTLTPTPTGTSTPTSTPKPTIPPIPIPSPTSKLTPYLDVSCKSSATYSHFKVDINGLLTANDTSLPNSPVLLSYSVDGGNSWEPLTLVNTDNNGRFSAEWMPLVTGNYFLKAVYAGNSDYSQVTTMVNFAVLPFEEKNVFSIASNSTVAAFVFNSTNEELSFRVSGESGTTGYVNVFIPKSLLSDTSGLNVYMDDNKLTPSIESQGDLWLVSFTYHHSTHQVTINIVNEPSPPFFESQLGQLAIVGLATIAIAIVAVVIVLKKRKGAETYREK